MQPLFVGQYESEGHICVTNQVVAGSSGHTPSCGHGATVRAPVDDDADDGDDDDDESNALFSGDA
jgi:hypothetical protein